MIILVIIVTIGTGAMIWVRMGSPMPPLSDKAASEAPKQFDTTSGQHMRPRWSQGEGAGYDAGYN
ncbi:Conjugal transfer protein TrbK (plasmid) [Aminobacter sp. MSH1]|nr:Conjugal transfer protein TrbK [Aminobacter sp. MSH1]